MARQKVDNFEALRDMFTFSNNDEFYYVFVIKRLKDGDETEPYDNTLPEVFDNAIYYSGWTITSYENLLEKKAEIVSLCEEKNARAYVTINPRTFTETNILAEELKSSWNVDGYEFMYAGIFGYLFNYYSNGRQTDERYYEWLNEKPRVLVDVDIDSKTGIGEIKEFLQNNGIATVTEANTPNGGIQFVCPNSDVKGLNFDYFDKYDRVGKLSMDAKYLGPAVHCLDDIAINLYANLK